MVACQVIFCWQDTKIAHDLYFWTSLQDAERPYTIIWLSPINTYWLKCKLFKRKKGFTLFLMFDLVNIKIILSTVKCSLHFFIYIYCFMVFFYCCNDKNRVLSYFGSLVLVTPGFFFLFFFSVIAFLYHSHFCKMQTTIKLSIFFWNTRILNSPLLI